ncbi:MAG TPA: hypothetical protein VMF13_13930 [Luteitalea sp.]|nr:hypothetical protein [Luteitalea sp.]
MMFTAIRRCATAFAVVVLLASPVGARATTPGDDERDVVAAVQRIFDAMATCDAATIRSLTMPEGRLYRTTPGATTPPRSTTLEDFSGQFATCARRMLERMWQPQVRIHKDIATLWAPYDFWLDGAFSHCGIDSFELVRTPSGWKLTGGIYTVEREGCAPSPLGPPAAKEVK